MMLQIAILFLSTLSVAYAKCDNACSGHGTCDLKSKCSCYDNWGLGLSHDSGDCSDRICPYEFAWVDTPDKKGRHHKYAECAAKGICDRTTGECACFPGYEGKGCQRTVCPNDCSGHGICSYIEDLGFQVTPTQYGPENQGYYPQSAITFPYYYWDSKKTRGCTCDPEYGDVDCSKRMCPYGTDVMDQRLDLTSAQKYQVQYISFVPDNGASLEGLTFALTFTSKLNETFTTIPLVYDFAASGFSKFLENIALALQQLPNRVIDKVTVDGNFDATSTNITIAFTGDYVQGPQNLLTVRSTLCGDGCIPKLTGLALAPKDQNVTEVVLADFNSYECGRRGKCDYTSGMCACFAGYTGVACNTVTALV